MRPARVGGRRAPLGRPPSLSRQRDALAGRGGEGPMMRGRERVRQNRRCHVDNFAGRRLSLLPWKSNHVIV